MRFAYGQIRLCVIGIMTLAVRLKIEMLIFCWKEYTITSVQVRRTHIFCIYLLMQRKTEIRTLWTFCPVLYITARNSSGKKSHFYHTITILLKKESFKRGGLQMYFTLLKVFVVNEYIKRATDTINRGVEFWLCSGAFD